MRRMRAAHVVATMDAITDSDRITCFRNKRSASGGEEEEEDDDDDRVRSCC